MKCKIDIKKEINNYEYPLKEYEKIKWNKHLKNLDNLNYTIVDFLYIPAIVLSNGIINNQFKSLLQDIARRLTIKYNRQYADVTGDLKCDIQSGLIVLNK